MHKKEGRKIRIFNPSYHITHNNLNKVNKKNQPSFEGRVRLNLEQQIESLNKKNCNLPLGVKRAVAKALADPWNTKTIYEIHNEVYAPLKNCKSLDEAKALFDDFKDVIEASELKETPVLQRIAAGEIEGLTIENMTLVFLKKIFVDVTGKNKSDEWFNLSGGTIDKLVKKLKIPRPNNAYQLMYKNSDADVRAKIGEGKKLFYALHPQAAQEHSQIMKKRIAEIPGEKERMSKMGKTTQKKHPEIKQNIINYWKNEENRKAKSEASTKYWEDESVRKKQSEKMKQFYIEHPEARAEISKRTTVTSNLYWSDPEARKKHSQTMYRWHQEHPEWKLCCDMAWNIHSDLKDKMRHLAKEEFPGLGNIRKKETEGISLTEAEKKYKNSYYARCSEKFSAEKAALSETQSMLYKEMRKKHGAILTNPENYE